MKYQSHVFTAASGSVAATTYSRNKNGNYIRSKGRPGNPKTPRQQTTRGTFTAISKAWRTLSEAQRTGWKTLGATMTTNDALGQSSTLTGAQAFMSVNGVLQTFGGSDLVADPPATVSSPGALPTITISAARAGTSDGAFSLLINSEAYTGHVQVYATKPVSAGINTFEKSAFRLLEVVDGLGAGTTVITAPYSDKYGTPTVGTKIAVKLVPVNNDGFKGANYEAIGIVEIGS